MVLGYSLEVRGQTALTRMRGALLSGAEVAQCFYQRDLERPVSFQMWAAVRKVADGETQPLQSEQG